MKIPKLRYLLITFFSVISYLGLSQKLPVIPLEEAYKKQEPITTKEFIESFTYIPLETTPDCLIDANPNIIIASEYVIIMNQKRCLLFNKANGKFIREICHRGKDPGGYLNSLGFFNALTSTLYLSGWNKDLIKYSLEGKEEGSVPIPNYNNSFNADAFIADNYDYLDKNLIVCHIFNTNGIQPRLIMMFDENGKEIRAVPNRNMTKEHSFSLSIGDLIFSHYKNKLLYNEIYRDTVFSLSTDKTEPYFIIKKGRLKPTPESRSSNGEQLYIKDFGESERYIWVKFYYEKNCFGLFDKSSSGFKAYDITSGIKNDTDGFLPFIPLKVYKEELIGMIQITDLLSWFEKNPGMKEKLPQKLKEYSTKDPTDNPIIVIAKLRK
jgi:hypothetical protein